MSFNFTDDSNQMYLADSLTIVDVEGVRLMTFNCRHERHWMIAGFCPAGGGLARCLDCRAYFHGGTWAPCQCAPFPSSAWTCRKCDFTMLDPEAEHNQNDCVEGGTCEWERR